MAEESTDLVRRFGGKNVLELAGLLLDLGFAVHGETVGEQAFRQAVAANNAAGTLAAAWREFDNDAAIADRG